MLLQSGHDYLLENTLINPKINIIVCFPILKGMFLHEKSEQKTLAETESLGWILSHAKVTDHITGVE